MDNSGIYEIRNLVNDKFYIGSAINLNKRKHNHLSDLRLNKHRNKHLQSSYNKHGEDKFEFTVLCECIYNELIKLEQKFIDDLNPEYNICKVAGSQLGMRRTNESRQRMREAQLGKKQPKEVIEKRMRKIRKPVVQLTEDGEFVQEFDSAKKAADALNISAGCCVTMCCQYHTEFKDIHRTAKGFIWMYKEQYENGNRINLTNE